jgi:hypothetical protein
MNPPVEHEYKLYQRLYEELVQEHSDDFANMEWIEHPELVQNALDYFRKAEFPLVYPAKSYAVAIIYATLLEQEYGIPLRESLDDSDLFLGHDEFFVIYSKDPDTYEAILTELAKMPNWITSGWAPKSAEYFRLECTAEGLESING